MDSEWTGTFLQIQVALFLQLGISIFKTMKGSIAGLMSDGDTDQERPARRLLLEGTAICGLEIKRSFTLEKNPKYTLNNL